MCQYCDFSVCMSCKLCLCNIDKLKTSTDNVKVVKKITEHASLKAII